MKPKFTPRVATIFTLLAIAALVQITLQLHAQQPRQQPPQFTSPEVAADRKITFRVHAPKAESIRLDGSGDIPGTGFNQASPLTEGENGVWSITVGPLPPGSYRYGFNIDGVPTLDPRNARTSESNARTWSLVDVHGADWLDTKDVPHGAVAEVTYWSSKLKKFRRLHVYTPPGYEAATDNYPVFYLLHGAFDSDDSWSTVGRAGIILDNLIAAGKAKPMVVVMPNGHIGPFTFGSGGNSMFGEFEAEFATDIMPLVEKRYRVHTDRANRAMAGLSMGGAHTLNIGIPHLEKFAYLGVYSSGVFGITGGGPSGQQPGPSFEERHKSILDDAKLKEGLKTFWFATGKDDFLVETSRATVEMFKKHKFKVVYHESAGGHTWDNWRDYLHQFAPQLFQ